MLERKVKNKSRLTTEELERLSLLSKSNPANLTTQDRVDLFLNQNELNQYQNKLQKKKSSPRHSLFTRIICCLSASEDENPRFQPRSSCF
jgi:hypothetical protein